MIVLVTIYLYIGIGLSLDAGEEESVPFLWHVFLASFWFPLLVAFACRAFWRAAARLWAKARKV